MGISAGSLRGSSGVGLTISADGVSKGILWETTGNTVGTLHAYDASNLGNELWNSDLDSAVDNLGGFAKFVNPTVVNGKVYVATSSGAVVVYGSLCAKGAVHEFVIQPARCREMRK